MDVKQPTPVLTMLPRWKRLDCADVRIEKSFCNKTRSWSGLQEWEDQCRICRDTVRTLLPLLLHSDWFRPLVTMSLKLLPEGAFQGMSSWKEPSRQSQFIGTGSIFPHLPTKEGINTMADTHIQPWLYIKTLNNIKKSSCPAVVHVKLLHDKMDADSELHADTQWIDGWINEVTYAPSTGVFKRASLTVVYCCKVSCSVIYIYIYFLKEHNSCSYWDSGYNSWRGSFTPTQENRTSNYITQLYACTHCQKNCSNWAVA